MFLHLCILFCYSVEDFVMSDEFSEEEDLPIGSLSKDEDSDFVMEEDEEQESGSDWEASQRSSQRSKGRVGGKNKGYKREMGKGVYLIKKIVIL